MGVRGLQVHAHPSLYALTGERRKRLVSRRCLEDNHFAEVLPIDLDAVAARSLQAREGDERGPRRVLTLLPIQAEVIQDGFCPLRIAVYLVQATIEAQRIVAAQLLPTDEHRSLVI